jgi:hypothetical protein
VAAIDDALSSARGAHYGVIATCVAAMLFAATPDLGAPYRAARRDLEALRAIDWDNARNTVIYYAQLQRGSRDSVWRDFLTRADNYAPINRDSLFIPLDNEWRGGIPTLPKATERSTVAQLIELGNTGAAKVSWPKILRGRPLHEIAPLCFRERHACSLVVRRKSDTTYVVTVTQIKDQKVLDSLQMRGAEDSIVSHPTMREYLIANYRNTFTAISLPPRAPDATRDTASRKKDTTSDTTSRKKEQEWAFVPSLAAVQREIGDLTPAQAAGVLEEKIAGHEQHMSAFGFSLGGNFVTLVGPVLLILTLMYLSFQINHLADLAPGNEKAISDFAWPLTFRGFPGIATAVVTLMILPAAAVLLLRIHGDNTNALSWGVAGVETWILLVLSVAAGIVCLVARNRLVRRTGLAAASR